MHIFITLEKGTILPPDFAKKYLWLIHDHGAVIFALFALIAIYVSYKISLAQIHRNKDKTRATIKKTPAMFRLINNNAYDARSLGAEILNLCAKNFLDLLPKDCGAVLIKKTDNLKNLSKTEQKLMDILFPGAETVLSSTAESRLKLNRAYKFLKSAVYRQFEFYKLKLNSVYLVFSLSMLLCGMIGAAAISINPWHTFWVILACTILLFMFIALCFVRFSNKYANIGIKIYAALSTLSIGAWLSIYTSNIYAVIIILSLMLIISFYRQFSRRSGLLRNKIKETEEYKSYLQKNASLAQNNRDFNAKMPYIFAFNLEQKYQDTETFGLINCILNQLTNNSVKE